MRHPDQIPKKKFSACSVIILLFLILICSPVHAASISAKFHQNNKTSISINIRVDKTAPSTLIVQVSIPGTNKISNTSPKFAKIDKNRNNAKWLLRDVRPGNITITVQTSQPINPGSVSATIRYRDRNNGSIMNLDVPSH